MRRVDLVVNGQRVTAHVDTTATLAQVLRDQLRLTGTKIACERGECGACTVLIDGKPRMSCITLAALVTGPVETIEGLAESGAMLREQFADRGAFQCGFCTPGQIVSGVATLRNTLPSDPGELRNAVRTQMNGNLCRCTGYQAIVESVAAVAERDMAS